MSETKLPPTPAPGENVVAHYQGNEVDDTIQQPGTPAAPAAPAAQPSVPASTDPAPPAVPADDFRPGDEQARARRVTGQMSDPAIGVCVARADSAPVHGAERMLGAPGGSAVRVDAAHFIERHKGDAILDRPAVVNGTFYVPGCDQGWREFTEQVLGDHLRTSPPFMNADPSTLRLVAQAVAHLNGRSGHEGLPEVVVVPSHADLVALLDSMHRRGAQSQANRPAPREPILRMQRDGKRIPTWHTPRAEHAYEPRWNDTLRGVVIAAYRDQLVGLTPDEADRRLRNIMLAVAAVNQLNSTDLADAGQMWLPAVSELEGVIGYLSAANPDGTTRLDDVKRRYESLWVSIERTGTGVNRDLALMRSDHQLQGTDRQHLNDEVRQARRVMRERSFSSAFGFLGFNPYAMGDWGFVIDAANNDTPPVESIPVRQPGESFKDYLNRVAPDLSNEEYRRTLENPSRFMMREIGLINGIGDQDERAKGDLIRRMQLLGLADNLGETKVEPRPGESLREAVDGMTLRALARAGILEALVAKLPEGERAAKLDELRRGSIESLVEASGWQSTLNAEQKQLLRVLVGWNQLVQLKGEVQAEATGQPNLRFAADELFSQSDAGFGRHDAGDLRQYLLRPDIRVEIEPDRGWLAGLLYDDGSGEPAVPRGRWGVSAKDEGAAAPNSEAFIAARRDARTVDQGIDRDRKAAIEAQKAVIASNRDINAADAEGKPRRGGAPVRKA